LFINYNKKNIKVVKKKVLKNLEIVKARRIFAVPNKQN